MDNAFKIDEKILAANSRVFTMTINGRDVFVKQRDTEKLKVARKLQKIVYWLTRVPMLVPTILKRDENCVLFQVEKMTAMRAAGLRVPEILYYTPDYFVMENSGESLTKILKRNPADALQLCEAAVRELAHLHRAGFAHGGAQIRNYVEKNGQITMIDFEERIPENFLDTLKVRDMLLFLLSTEQAHLDLDLRRLCDIYRDETGTDVYAELSQILRYCRFVPYLVRAKNRLGIRKGSDLHYFSRFVEKMVTLHE